MSAPSKPWEGLSHRPAMATSYLDDRIYPQRPGGLAPPGPGQPPPLPPRRSQSHSSYGPAAGLYSGFGGGYGSSYMSPFGSPYGSSPYGMPFSQYRTPYDPRYGNGGEDGQSPFQSVESVVRAISSLSMMMESTYQSMFMSFRAVMGVAENMERLRRVVIDLFGGIAIIKSVIWFFKKILYIMGLIKNNPSREKLWEAAAAEVVSAASNTPERTRRTWPLVAFFGLMLGGPYVLYKLMPQDGAQDWDPRKDGVKCVALYDFDTNQRGELPFRRGEVLVRQRKAQGGWALAAKQNGQTGYVPSDRLKPISSVQQKMAPKPNADRFLQPNQPVMDIRYRQPGPAHMNPSGYGLPQNNPYVHIPTAAPVVEPPMCVPIPSNPIDDVIDISVDSHSDATDPVLPEPATQSAPQDP